MYGFLIAGTHSGCGKTTISIGLMAMFHKMGMKVAPFKTGPDYIDPLFHKYVLNIDSYNLDSFLLSKNTIRHLFHKHTRQKDITIVEGVMGMYDGMGENSVGSSYELSSILNLPIILVVNCKSMYQSVAAIVKGFSQLKADSNVRGVILNNVYSSEQYNFLKNIIKDTCDIECFGYLPPDNAFNIDSRHLGLIQAEEIVDLDKKTDLLVKKFEKTIDKEALLSACQIDPVSETTSFPEINLHGLHLGIAYDKSFRFYYRDNLELLEASGATLHYFSPLKDNSIPDACNALYIGGGYPEVFGRELASNQTLMAQIRSLSEKGLPIYAECGGLMYLSDTLITLENETIKMCGVFDFSVQMTGKLNHFGYADLAYNSAEGKCHEFHRSQVIGCDEKAIRMFDLTKPEKKETWKCGYKKNNTLAGYPHIHFYSNHEFTRQIFDLWTKKTM